MTDPKIREVSENNVEVIFPKTMIDTMGKTFETFDHNDPSLKENFGKTKIADRIDTLTAQKTNWQDEKWVAEFVQKRIDTIDQQLTAYNLVQDKLNTGVITPVEGVSNEPETIK